MHARACACTRARTHSPSLAHPLSLARSLALAQTQVHATLPSQLTPLLLAAGYSYESARQGTRRSRLSSFGFRL